MLSNEDNSSNSRLTDKLDEMFSKTMMCTLSVRIDTDEVFDTKIRLLLSYEKVVISNTRTHIFISLRNLWSSYRLERWDSSFWSSSRTRCTFFGYVKINIDVWHVKNQSKKLWYESLNITTYYCIAYFEAYLTSTLISSVSKIEIIIRISRRIMVMDHVRVHDFRVSWIVRSDLYLNFYS